MAVHDPKRHVTHIPTAPWQSLRTRQVFSAPYFGTLIEDLVEQPSGNVESWIRWADEREGVRPLHGVLGMVRDQRDRILLTRQYRLGPDVVITEFPGGAVDDGEQLTDAVRREVAEETGLRPRRVRLLGRTVLDGRSAARISMFVCEDLVPSSQSAADTELIELEWATADELDRRILSDEIFAADTLACWALYKSDVKLRH